MLESIWKSALELKDKVLRKTELEIMLEEATNTDNWNVPNSKLQQIAEHSHDWNEYNVIMKHLWEILNLKPKENVQIFKALVLMEFLIKNGATRIIQDLKDDIFKIRTLQECTYHEDGIDKCRGIREKAKSICDLIADPERLEEEREFSKKNREKFRSFANEEGSQYYKGINEDDIYKSKYDTKKNSRDLDFKKKEEKKHETSGKKKHKKKKRESSSEKSESSKSSSSERSSSREKKKSKNKKSKEKSSEKEKSKKTKKNSEEKEVKKDDLFDIFDTDNSSNQKQQTTNNAFDTSNLFDSLTQTTTNIQNSSQAQVKSIPRPPQFQNIGSTQKQQTNEFDIFSVQSSVSQNQGFPSYPPMHGAPPTNLFSPPQTFGTQYGFSGGSQTQQTPASFTFQNQQPPTGGDFITPPSADIFGTPLSTGSTYIQPKTSFVYQGVGVQKPAQTTGGSIKQADDDFTAFQSSQPETFSGIGGLVNLGSLKKKEEPPKTEKKVNLFSSQSTSAPTYANSWGAPISSAGFGYTGGMGTGANMYAPQPNTFSSASMYTPPQATFGYTQTNPPATQYNMSGFTGFAPPPSNQNKSSSTGFGSNSKGSNSLFD